VKLVPSGRHLWPSAVIRLSLGPSGRHSVVIRPAAVVIQLSLVPSGRHSVVIKPAAVIQLSFGGYSVEV